MNSCFSSCRVERLENELDCSKARLNDCLDSGTYY